MTARLELPDNIFRIAKNEAKRTLSRPITILIMIVLAFITIINGTSGAHYIAEEAAYASGDPLLSLGMGGIGYGCALFLSVFAMVLGLSAIAEERSDRSLGVLITKPVYRRGIVVGKLLGIYSLLFIVAFLCMALSLASLIVTYQGPRSPGEAFLRTGTCAVMIFLAAATTVNVTMIIGSVVKNLTGSLLCSISYLFVVWYTTPDYILRILYDFLPSMIFFMATGGSKDMSLFDTSFGYGSWLSYTMPSITILLLEVVLLSVIACFLFWRSDE